MLYNIRMLRILLIAATVTLYAISWSHTRHVPDSIKWENHKVLMSLYSSREPGPVYKEEFINEAQEGRMSHVSTLASLPNGWMMAAWYSGSREGAKDVSIYISRYDPTKGWDEPRVLIDRDSAMRDMGIYIKKLGNPVLYQDGKGQVFLFYASVSAGGWSGASLNYTVSTDWGESWTPSKKLYLSPFFNIALNVKNPPISLDDGSFVLPIYHEFITKYSLAMRVRQIDKTSIDTELRRMTSSESAIQPSLLPGPTGGIRALMRNMGSESEKHILRADSPNAGLTWGEVQETQLPNPNSGFDTATTPSGQALAVINDSYKDRSNLTLFITVPDKDQWQKLWVFDQGDKKEFSYPTLVRSMDGKYHLTYTYDRKRIKHVMFDDAWLKERIADAGSN